MRQLERANLEQIEALNQRGGRTLSIVDLIRAGTIGVEAAAYAGHRISQGASILTAANPGGAGKTALLAALLGFLPPERPILTLASAEAVSEAEAEQVPRCFLVHEIGAGHWYGYLWGPAVARYLQLASGRHQVASCLHADSMEEMRAKLSASPLGVTPSDLLGVDLVLFMHVDRGGSQATGGYRRRVASIYESDRASRAHRQICQWDRERDEFSRLAEAPGNGPVSALQAFLEALSNSGPLALSDFRSAYLSHSNSGRG